MVFVANNNQVVCCLGEGVVRDQDQPESPLDIDFYTRFQSQFLKSQLPSVSVANLAREVIQRLAEQDEELPIEAPSDDQIEHLCFALMADDHLAGATFISDVRGAGASIDAVYLKYLARAARKLGDWWDDDLVSFTEVTLGTSRMYAIMRSMRRQMPLKLGRVLKSAIFVSVPDENHTLGVRMAADLFRKDGWDIDLLIDEDHDSLVSYIVQSGVPIVGISAGGQHSLQALSQLIVALRIKSPSTALFISGHITEEAKDEIKLLGVDGIANDIDSAWALMSDIWDTLHRQ